MRAGSGMESDSNEVSIWGTHGTCESFAEQIFDKGFKQKPGRIGVGAYFWTAVSDSDECMELARKLAKTWATKAEKAGQYAGEAKKKISIVEVRVTFEEQDMLDLDSPMLTYRLWSLIRKKLAELLGLNNEEDWQNARIDKRQEEIHGFIEAFILELETNLDRRFKVIFKSQGCPKFSDPILPYIGNHSCFAIRDTDVISIMNITN
jgi:hypothetical protein